MGGELVEGRLEPRERPRAFCDMGCVVIDEVAAEPVDLGRGEGAPLGRKPAFDHVPGAATHHVAGGLIGDRRQTFAGKHGVERGDQIGRGVDQRPVEIENSGSDHGPRSLPAGGDDGKALAAAGNACLGCDTNSRDADRAIWLYAAAERR